VDMGQICEGLRIHQCGGALLGAYIRAYGAWTFVSSIVTSVFLAWAWCRRLWPYWSSEFAKELERADNTKRHSAAG